MQNGQQWMYHLHWPTINWSKISTQFIFFSWKAQWTMVCSILHMTETSLWKLAKVQEISKTTWNLEGWLTFRLVVAWRLRCSNHVDDDNGWINDCFYFTAVSTYLLKKALLENSKQGVQIPELRQRQTLLTLSQKSNWKFLAQN